MALGAGRWDGTPRGCPGLQGRGPCWSRRKLWKLGFVWFWMYLCVFMHLELDSCTYCIFFWGLAEFEFMCFGESVLISFVLF